MATNVQTILHLFNTLEALIIVAIPDANHSIADKMFARRVTRQREDPSRASDVSALLSSSLRKPDRIMLETESVQSETARNFSRFFNELGYTTQLYPPAGNYKLGCKLVFACQLRENRPRMTLAAFGRLREIR